jgi:hypothetical protein
MQLLPLTAQQRAVRCVLHQRMLEGVDRAALEDRKRDLDPIDLRASDDCDGVSFCG